MGLLTLAMAQQPKETVSSNYLAAADALAADNFAAAKTALSALAKESQGIIKTQAQAAADAADIAAMRRAFKPLSENVIKMQVPDGYGVVYCPMFDSAKGASWVQKRGKVANPYYGKAMQECGAFK
jgi:Cu(I)/Ag(I) efflux system membrane fusion protein